MKKVLWSIVLISVVYVGGYIVFRQSNIQYWPKDKKIYVIFPTSAPYIYYLWRPLSRLDGAITGINFHIGAHR